MRVATAATGDRGSGSGVVAASITATATVAYATMLLAEPIASFRSPIAHDTIAVSIDFGRSNYCGLYCPLRLRWRLFLCCLRLHSRVLV